MCHQGRRLFSELAAGRFQMVKRRLFRVQRLEEQLEEQERLLERWVGSSDAPQT